MSLEMTSHQAAWAVDGQLWESLVTIGTNWQVLSSALGQRCPTELSVMIEMF